MSLIRQGRSPSRRPTRLLLIALILPALTGAGVADLNESGKAAYARGDYSAAERLFSQALKEAPEEPVLHYHRGVALMRLGRWREAAAAFETALRLSPSPDITAAAKEGIHALAPLLAERGAAPATRTRDESVITLRRLGGNWVTDVRLNESRTATFLVDTGASVCLISPDLARELDIQPDREASPVSLQTISGRTSGPVVRISSIRVGEAEAEDVPAVIHSLGPSMDGILGNTFLSRFRVTLDPQRGLLHLTPR